MLRCVKLTLVQGIPAFRDFRNTDIFSFNSGGTITDGRIENGKIVADKLDDLLNIQFQPLINGYNQYFFVRKVNTEDTEGNDVNLDTDEISRLNFSIILTDPPDSDLRCKIYFFFSSHSLKMREKYISFAQFVFLCSFCSVCIFFEFQ